MNIPVNSWLRALLALVTSDSTGLSGVWVGLYTGLNASPGPNLVMANLTEASYTGYARQRVASWTAPYQSSVTGPTVIDSALHFTPGDASFPQTMLGAFYASDSIAGAGDLFLLDPFAAPGVGLIGPTNILTYTPAFALPVNANYGGGGVES